MSNCYIDLQYQLCDKWKATAFAMVPYRFITYWLNHLTWQAPSPSAHPLLPHGSSWATPHAPELGLIALGLQPDSQLIRRIAFCTSEMPAPAIQSAHDPDTDTEATCITWVCLATSACAATRAASAAALASNSRCRSA